MLRAVKCRPVTLAARVATPRSTIAAASTPATIHRLVHVGVKSDTTPAPIELSEEQSIPIGAYYEYILKEPQPIPKEKSEAPPASATKSAKSVASDLTATSASKD